MKRIPAILLSLSVMNSALWAANVPAPDIDGFRHTVAPLLATYCIDCHGPDDPEGNLSLDNIDRLNDFSADPEYCADKLAVASDESGDIARSYGINVREGREGATDTRGVEIGHGFAERITFIVTSDKKIVETIGGVSPMQNVRD